jgi:tRNA(Ile)-lysidine synthase
MQTKISTKVQRSLIGALDKTKKYLVACSGGSDSIALTHAMFTAGFQMEVGHVEHGLRGEESLSDAEFVQKFCKDRNIPCQVRHVKVKNYCKEHKLSIEDGARVLRFTMLREMATAAQADFIVTAHQKNDQAETFLMMLMRGAGLEGLGAMKEQREDILHPLLNFSSEDLKDYCREQKLSWCEDSSNKDLTFTRNRVRQSLLPLLAKDYNPNIIEVLARTAAILQNDAQCLHDLAQTLAKKCMQVEAGKVVCDMKLWYKQAPALQLGMLKELWVALEPKQALSSKNLFALQSLCLKGVSGKHILLPSGSTASYAYGKLVLQKAKPKLTDASGERLSLSWPKVKKGGSYTVCGTTIKIKLTQGKKLTPSKNRFVYPWRQVQKVGPELTLRGRLPGDVFTPYKGTGSKKLKEFFIDSKIPSNTRAKILLVATGQQVLWVTGMRQGAWKAETYQEAQAWLVITLEKGEKNHE